MCIRDRLSSGWEIDNGRWKLKLAYGTYATSSWQQVKGKKYWFGADSYAVTGWQTIDEKRYYFDSSCALRTDGWLKDDGSLCWLSSCGVMQTGWLKPVAYTHLASRKDERPCRLFP